MFFFKKNNTVVSTSSKEAIAKQYSKLKLMFQMPFGTRRSRTISHTSFLLSHFPPLVDNWNVPKTRSTATVYSVENTLMPNYIRRHVWIEGPESGWDEHSHRIQLSWLAPASCGSLCGEHWRLGPRGPLTPTTRVVCLARGTAVLFANPPFQILSKRKRSEVFWTVCVPLLTPLHSSTLANTFLLCILESFHSPNTLIAFLKLSWQAISGPHMGRILNPGTLGKCWQLVRCTQSPLQKSALIRASEPLGG